MKSGDASLASDCQSVNLDKASLQSSEAFGALVIAKTPRLRLFPAVIAGIVFVSFAILAASMVQGNASFAVTSVQQMVGGCRD